MAGTFDNQFESRAPAALVVKEGCTALVVKQGALLFFWIILRFRHAYREVSEAVVAVKAESRLHAEIMPVEEMRDISIRFRPIAALAEKDDLPTLPCSIEENPRIATGSQQVNCLQHGGLSAGVHPNQQVHTRKPVELKTVETIGDYWRIEEVKPQSVKTERKDATTLELLIGLPAKGEKQEVFLTYRLINQTR